jgi:hypothetical protein
LIRSRILSLASGSAATRSACFGFDVVQALN